MSEVVRNFKIETISPLHIGSGVEFDRWSFVTEGLKVKIVDVNTLFELNQENTYLLNNFASDIHKNLTELVSKAGIKTSEVPILYSIQASDTSGMNSIREYMKTRGTPILPGTSIKGAIRTAILWHLIKQNENDFNRKFKSAINDRKQRRQLLDSLFQSGSKKKASSAQNDFMRCLHTSDVFFKLSDLAVYPTRLLNIQGKNLRFKQLGPKPMTIHCEFIMPKKQSTSTLRIKIDTWLLKENFPKAEFLLKDFSTICNEFYKYLAEEELKFFSTYKNDNMKRFYESLIEEINSSGSEIYLHLGWGSGWRSMTGSWLEGDMLQTIRKTDRLGKRGFPIFPKTRKAVFFSDVKILPPGWIKLKEAE